MSDPDRAKTVMRRAIDFASRLPDPPDLAQRYSPELLRAARDRVHANLTLELGEMETSGILDKRRKSAMYIGPWTDPGEPLRDTWK